jgi:phenylalanyl-tRNA synthetase alpha chain
MIDTQTIKKQFETEIKTVADIDQLETLRIKYIGRKNGIVTDALAELVTLTVEQKRKLGPELNALRNFVTSTLETYQTRLSESGQYIDMTIPSLKRQTGHLHPLTLVERQLEDIFHSLGFTTEYGPEIESEENNFNKLNIPADHPARDSQDTFWISGMKDHVLRTHTSNVQIRYAQKHKPPFRMICLGKVYRKDSDATHSPMFHQLEGMMIGKDVSLANMKAVMETAVRELIDHNAEFRWRTGFFPFVEPGLEMDMRWRGDESKSREGKWLEICGCGMTHPNVLKNCGIDPNKWQGFAFGFGIERMLMIKHQIPDLRLFYSGDLRFLKQF